MRLGVVLLCLSLAACGGATATASSPRPAEGTGGAERPGCDRVASAARTLGGCRGTHAADPGWPARGAYDALVPRLTSHLASLEPARPVTSDEVEPLAEASWDLLDQITISPGTEPARGRAETAIERLLRERDPDAAPGAAIEVLGAVTQLAAVADPTGGADPCAAEALALAQARASGDVCEE